MICVSLISPTTEGMLRDADRAEQLGAEFVEFRLDYVRNIDLPRLIAWRKLATIFTCRPRREGGQFDGEESARIALLQKAIDLGAELVDVELDSASAVRRGGRAKLIVSVHDFEKTPDDLAGIYRSIAATGADVVKIAVTATDIRDNLRVLELLKRADRKIIALAMGERGVVSRILGPNFGSLLTYAALDASSAAAPGQLTVEEMLNLYRCCDIGDHTQIFGVIANPIAHSMSPLIHNTAFAHLGLDCVYLPFLVDDVTDFIARFRGLPVKGFSVTIPHKERAMESADEVDPLTRRIGALNTLVERKGRLVGTNTDCSAALGAMEHALGGRKHGVSPLKGKRALLVGARGTARAVAAGLIDAGAQVRILNRTADKARTLAADLSCGWGPLDELAGAAAADVIINATPVGMHPNVDASIVPAGALRKGMLVFDAVYNPVETKLIQDARARGCLTVTGLEMFVAQAAEQFRLFTGEKPPVDIMRDIVERKLAGAR